MTAKALSIFDRQILSQAVVESFKKLNPITMLKNPVMFVTEVGAIITTASIIFRPETESLIFGFQIAAWLWFTVLFANFAEAMAEGRGKAQADALRKTRTQTIAHLLLKNGLAQQDVPADKLRKGDEVVVSAGDIIPAESWEAPSRV
ncbi:MAG: potassium-transporting ATPase ATP-binding subunit [Thermodesulfobacteriota bacterium]|nr:potassium-transporting ATPase ATP-binding subunit [Thermodesulfobacteriota bacterium]